MISALNFTPLEVLFQLGSIIPCFVWISIFWPLVVSKMSLGHHNHLHPGICPKLSFVSQHTPCPLPLIPWVGTQSGSNQSVYCFGGADWSDRMTYVFLFLASYHNQDYHIKVQKSAVYMRSPPSLSGGLRSHRHFISQWKILTVNHQPKIL